MRRAVRIDENGSGEQAQRNGEQGADSSQREPPQDDRQEAAIGYLIDFPLLSAIARVFGFTVPSPLQPVLVALLLGVVTDHRVLLFDAFRDELDAGLDRGDAARSAVSTTAPIVAVAGLTVAGGTLSLTAAPYGIFRALGPALALEVAVGLAVCLTLTPAMMALLGRRLFTTAWVDHSAPGSAGRPTHASTHRLIGVLTRRPVAALASILALGVKALAATPVARPGRQGPCHRPARRARSSPPGKPAAGAPAADLRVPLQSLLFGYQLQSVTPTEDGLVVLAGGTEGLIEP